VAIPFFHPQAVRLHQVAFTGSVPTGRRISVAAAESNLKKVTLELGGKSPLIVFPSADVDDAATWTANGIWFNMGQDCCASSRVGDKWPQS
jgi:aldehyde dehydrogenase (NAD+)